jgi:hypothetical protein
MNDLNGNTQTSVGSTCTTYSWHFENRLTSVVLPGSGRTVYFKYDPFGRHPNSSHSRGEAVDFNRADNACLSRPDAERSTQQCFPKGYGQEERNSPKYKPLVPDDPAKSPIRARTQLFSCSRCA